MRAAFRKAKPPVPKPSRVKAPDASKQLIKMRRWVEQSLAEVKEARGYMASQFAGPEHECLEWAQQFLENALNGKAANR
jgi:hypothetical protein